MSLVQHGYEVFHRDPSTVAAFYVHVLGFRLDPPTDARERTLAGHDYLVVARDALRVGCGRHPDASATPRRPPHGSEVVLRVDDIDAEHARVLATGWPLADPLQQRPWGMTDFRLFDPSGQYVRVTGPRAAP